MNSPAIIHNGSKIVTKGSDVLFMGTLRGAINMSGNGGNALISATIDDSLLDLSEDIDNPHVMYGIVTVTNWPVFSTDKCFFSIVDSTGRSIEMYIRGTSIFTGFAYRRKSIQTSSDGSFYNNFGPTVIPYDKGRGTYGFAIAIRGNTFTIKMCSYTHRVFLTPSSNATSLSQAGTAGEIGIGINNSNYYINRCGIVQIPYANFDAFIESECFSRAPHKIKYEFDVPGGTILKDKSGNGVDLTLSGFSDTTQGSPTNKWVNAYNLLPK